MPASEDASQPRLKFYGLNDMGTYMQPDRLAKALARHVTVESSGNLNDVVELENLRRFIEAGILPSAMSSAEEERVKALARELRSTVARYFRSLTDDTLSRLVESIGHEYRTDLLDLFAEHGVIERCSAAAVLSALERAGLSLRDLLSSKRLVNAAGDRLRESLITNPADAELLVQEFFQSRGSADRKIHFPVALSTQDRQGMLDRYIDYPEAHPNYIELISVAPLRDSQATGLTPAIKVRAARRYEDWLPQFLATANGIVTQCEVVLAADQLEPMTMTLSEDDNNLSYRYSFSERWLTETIDFPSICNNLVYVFELADDAMLLRGPSHEADLGFVDRYIAPSSAGAYPVGEAFRLTESCLSLKLMFYMRFLRRRDIKLEDVIAWFLTEYLNHEYGAQGFRFAPSSPGSSTLEKCRHAFPELEGMAKQFEIFVRYGELDLALMAVDNEPVSYNHTPSLVPGKYVYPSSDLFRGILHHLFSDQSPLNYINETLHETSAAELLTRHHVHVNEFADYQRPLIDELTSLGILRTDDGGRVNFASRSHVAILSDMYYNEVGSYYHYPETTRRLLDTMVAEGWLEREGTLLSRPEADYYNYCLNNKSFTNNLNLRNKYSHGSQPSAENEREHQFTYVTAMRLTLGLMIKINDDLDLHRQLM